MFIVEIRILVYVWNLKSVISGTPLLKLPLMRINSKAAGKGRAICSPTLRLLAIRLLNALFKNYKRTRREMQILAKLGISYYFRKPKRKKKKIEIYLLSMKRNSARFITDASPEVSMVWGKGET